MKQSQNRTCLETMIQRVDRKIERRARRLTAIKAQIKGLYEQYDQQLEKLLDTVGRSAVEGGETVGVPVGRTEDNKVMVLRDNFAGKNRVFRPACARRFDLEVK